MNIRFCLLLLSINFFSCYNTENQSFAQNKVRDITVVDLLPLRPGPKDYAVTRTDINTHRVALAKAYQQGNVNMDSVRKYFTTAFVEGIFPYWYGTPWSFDGHTDKPMQGEIACGYFVSTTLLHVGLNLNRYKLAQQSPENEAKTIAMTKEATVLHSRNPDSTKIKLNAMLKEGLYFVGLGSGHVGYLYKKSDQLMAIHSNYMPPNKYVLAQKFDTSVYRGFDTFYIADITWNDDLLKAWLKGDQIKK
jgi:hypothetical protein